MPHTALAATLEPLPNPDKPEPKRFGRKDAQDSKKTKTLLLPFCLCLFAANFFQFEKNLTPWLSLISPRPCVWCPFL